MIDDTGSSEESTVHTSLVVSRLTDVSLRQLQWWDEQGLVSPRQVGHRRLYTSFEVLQVSLIMALRKKGISLQKIRPLLGKLSLQQVREAVNHDGRHGDAYLVTDGEEVHLEHSPLCIVEILLGSDQPMIALSISELNRGIEVRPRRGSRCRALRNEPGALTRRPSPRGLLSLGSPVQRKVACRSRQPPGSDASEPGLSVNGGDAASNAPRWVCPRSRNAPATG